MPSRCVAALAFTAILQLLSAAFGTAGKFVAVVLLMLQLTSSAGTFPHRRLVPRFFQVISPVLPDDLRRSRGLRQAISGGEPARSRVQCAASCSATPPLR